MSGCINKTVQLVTQIHYYAQDIFARQKSLRKNMFNISRIIEGISAFWLALPYVCLV